MTKNKFPEILNRIFHIVFLVSFGLIFLCVILFGYHDDKQNYSVKEQLFVILGFVILLAFFTAVYIIIQKYNGKPKILAKGNLTDRNIKLIIFSVTGIMFAIQLLIGYLLEMKPVTDLNYLNQCSLDFAQNGNFDFIQKNYQNGDVYLIRYPNNLAILFLLSFFYRTAYLILGYVPMYLPVLVNAAAINISVLLTVFTARKIYGNKKAIMVLILSFLFAPYYTYVSYYYTDSISIPFCIAAIYLFICAVKSDSRYKKYILLAISGSLIFLGYKLKGSLVLLLAVTIIFLYLKFKMKKTVCLILALAAGFGIVGSIYNIEFDNSKIITKEESDKCQYPYTHWIMMGLKGLGHYNQKDSQYTASYPDIESKQEANLKEINNRIKTFGFIGLSKHIVKKAVWTWEDGTYFISHHIEQPIRENFLHSFVLDKGENHLIFYIYSCGFQLFLMFMICLSILRGCIKPEINIQTFLKGIVFAAFVFFIIWETRSRYLYNFTPVFILLSIDGFEFLTERIKFLNNILKSKI